jgi:hypothetical protein
MRAPELFAPSGCSLVGLHARRRRPHTRPTRLPGCIPGHRRRVQAGPRGACYLGQTDEGHLGYGLHGRLVEHHQRHVERLLPPAAPLCARTRTEQTRRRSSHAAMSRLAGRENQREVAPRLLVDGQARHLRHACTCIAVYAEASSSHGRTRPGPRCTAASALEIACTHHPPVI